MNIIEYGQENKDVIILLHGGGLSWWNYGETAELLRNKFHVILPILDGHAGSSNDFTSIERNAAEIIEYIDARFHGSVLLIGGLSLGGQIVVEMLTQRHNICKIALIESALILPMRLTHHLVEPLLNMSYTLIRKPWFSRLQFKSLRLKEDLFNVYFEDSCGISKENMISFLRANSHYSAKKQLSATSARVCIFVGQKESRRMIRSAQKLNEVIPNSVLEIKAGLYHGEFSINHAQEFAATLVKIMEAHQ